MIKRISNKKKQRAFIKKAIAEIKNCGWELNSVNIYGDKSHLVFTRNSERKGFGLFDTTYCWSLAYESITGKPYTDLI